MVAIPGNRAYWRADAVCRLIRLGGGTIAPPLVAAFNPRDPGFARGDLLIGGGKAIGGITLVLGALRGPVNLAPSPLLFLCGLQASDGVLVTFAADTSRLGEHHALS
jgi:hypothetical protein